MSKHKENEHLRGKETKNSNGNDVFAMYRALGRDAIHGYVYWSLFQGLAPMIWFYPLNELEISGYEAFAVVWLCPAFLGVPGLLSVVQHPRVLGLMRLLAVLGLASFQAPSTLSRLVVLALATGVSTLVTTAALWSPSLRIRHSYFWGLGLGLFAFVASRIWFTSFVPTWWSVESNSVIITLGVMASIDTLVTGADHVEKAPAPPRPGGPSWGAVGAGLGSLLFLTHWCLGEVSIITRWVVAGYPNHGPLPLPWGAPVLVAMLLGAWLSLKQGVGASLLWWILGAAGLVSLYFLPTWLGYAGGLVVAVYVTSVWPRMVDQAWRCPPARTMTLAMAVYIVEVLFSVWTVAYNFVPGGVYTREHTNWLVGAVLLLLLAGLKSGGDCSRTPSMVGGDKVDSAQVNACIKVLLVVVLHGLLGFAARHQSLAPTQSAQGDKSVFTAAIWTYHFGYDNKGWPSLERSASLLNDTGADFITLLESDASKTFLGNNDLGTWLGEKLGMHVDFGPSTRDHTWGNLILSRYPIVSSRHHLLPSPHGELAPAISATVNISGHLMDFVVTHMGNDRDMLDRKLQAEFLAQELRNSTNPVVFLGYVTSAPGSREYQQLIKGGKVKDIDETDLERWCEYIMYRGLIRLGYARISHGGLSDTEVQVARFRIPDSKKFKDNYKLTIDAAQVDPALLFNSRFGSYHVGHGYFPDHRFHMSTPKYFLP